jgi:hypothetical protein
MTTQHSKKKRFDCVEMMHQGAARVQTELAGKSVEERVAYFRESTQALLDRQARLQKQGLQIREQK